MRIFTICILVLSGCAISGTAKIKTTPDMESFEKALIHYVRGELALAEENLNRVLAKKPFDLRAHDLLSAIHKETGKSAKTNLKKNLIMSELDPLQIVMLIDCRNILLRQAVYEIIESRAEFREANFSIGAEMDLVTRFHPSGILAGLVQEITGGLWKREALLARAEARMLASLARYSVVREQAISEALAAYLDICLGNDTLSILQEENKICKEHLRVISNLVDHGELLANYQVESELRLAINEKEITDATNKVESSTARLNALLGQDVLSKISVKNKKIKFNPPNDMKKTIELVRARAEIKEMLEKIQEVKADSDVKTRDIVKIDLRSTYGKSSSDKTSDFLDGFGVGARLRTPILALPLNEAISSKHQAIVNRLELEVTRLFLVSMLKTIDAFDQIQKGYSSRKVAMARLKKAIQEEKLTGIQTTEGKQRLYTSIEAKINVSSSKRALIEQEYTIQKGILDVLLLIGTRPESIFEE